MSGVSVEYMKKITFSLLPLPEKIEIINLGRPTPKILIHTSNESKSKKYLKNFNLDWYEKIKWLCGCDTKNALFCFPCLLFGGDTVWTKNGFTCFSKMKEKTEKHQNSKRHMANMLSMSLLSQVNLTGRGYTSDALNTDERVKEQQNILSKVIDCLKFGAMFELSLNRNGEVFSLMENFISNLEPHFRKHTLVCGNTSEATKNGLLLNMLDLCRERIVSEIQEASYAAIICEDVSHVSESVYSIISFRYELRGAVYERFWGLLSTQKVANSSLSNCLINEINNVMKKKWKKLIALSYLGFMNGENREIENVYTNAHYVHNFSDDLDSIIKQLTSSVKSVRIFFADLRSLKKFLTNNPLKLGFLYNQLNGTIPLPSTFDIITIHKIKRQLIQYFQELQISDATDKTLQSAARFSSLLKNENFLFWLELFNKIIPVFEVLHQDVRTIDPVHIPQTVNDFCQIIVKICNSVNLDSWGNNRILESQRVGNCICSEMKERLVFIGHLTALKLFSRNDLEKYQSQIPVKLISETCKWYSELVEEKLKIELQVFYSEKKFQGLNFVSLLNALYNENLCSMFSELIKLLKILITIPIKTSETLHSSILKKVKLSVKGKIMSLERLTTLCMISAENDMIFHIDHFNEKVLEKYHQNGGLQLYYK